MPDLRFPRLLPALAALALLAACGETGPEEQAADDSPPVHYSGAASPAPREEDPDKLLGLEVGTIHDLLGDPALVRRDGEAEVWQYRAAACVLDLFIYGQPKRVAHVDLRDRGGAVTDGVRSCFAAMLKGEIPSS